LGFAKNNKTIDRRANCIRQENRSGTVW